jgi:hypothetical protein
MNPPGQEPIAQPGQEPAVSQPQTPPNPTPPTPAGQEPQTFDAEYVKTLRAEAAKHRKDAADTAARLKQFEDAQLSDAEKLKKQADDATARADALTRELRQERARVAVGRAASEAGVPAELAERLVEVEFEDDGSIKTDVPKALKALIDKYPHLKPAAAVTAGGATNPARSGADAAPRKSAADWLYGGQSSIFDPDLARAQGGGVIWDSERNPKQRE